jgi:hypothetical protein
MLLKHYVRRTVTGKVLLLPIYFPNNSYWIGKWHMHYRIARFSCRHFINLIPNHCVWALVTNPNYQTQPRECANDKYKKQCLVIEPILTVWGFGSKILWIKDFVPTGNQDGHENSAFSICRKQLKIMLPLWKFNIFDAKHRCFLYLQIWLILLIFTVCTIKAKYWLKTFTPITKKTCWLQYAKLLICVIIIK